ncbi:hypothetical protein A8F95_02340 [Bacillus wudalianchiensis]|uniref:DUF3139 domain-containing protein n=2 Tax=Pseudobacillus wudalianchiensis TaxID=1743143 RepID=A0A1B9BA69_9BACI|nr:hypothetical protein A8F95_02340 [Bacillus wudalianchiensis]
MIIVILMLIIVFLLPVAVIFRLNYGSPYQDYLLNKHVPPYLEKTGYADEDILEQHTGYPNESSNKDYFHTQYIVKFKDEPDITYYYGVRKKGKIVKQFCERYSPKYRNISGPTKHSEDDCVNYYDNK